MEKYELTVVTTTYNQEKYIEKCIESIMMQKTNFKFQLIVSNDNSSDDTSNILKKLKKKYKSNLKIINRKENLGPMNNFITTLNDVHTKYVALCDGDDYWTDDTKLQKQYEFLEKHKDYNICFHQTLIKFEDDTKENILHPLNLKNTLTLKNLLEENFIPANTVVYRWKYIKKNSLVEDFPKDIVPGDYYLHLMHAKDGKIKYIDKQMSVYRRQESGMWYLTTQPNKQVEFYYLYGKKYYNFYKQSEIKLNMKGCFQDQKEWILKNYVKAIIKRRKKKELEKILESEYKDNYNVLSVALSELNRLDKLFYHLVKKSYFKKR